MKRLVWILALGAVGASFPCCRKAPSPSSSPTPTSAPAPATAASGGIWSHTSLPRRELKPFDESLIRPQAAFHAVDSLPINKQFDWESDKQIVLKHLGEFHSLMDASSKFSSMKDSSVDSQGLWIIDGKTTEIDVQELYLNADIIRYLVLNHENLTDAANRARVESFALALIALGEEITAVKSPPGTDTLLVRQQQNLVAIACILLDALDSADEGHRLNKPINDIRKAVNEAADQEIRRMVKQRESERAKQKSGG